MKLGNQISIELTVDDFVSAARPPRTVEGCDADPAKLYPRRDARPCA